MIGALVSCTLYVELIYGSHKKLAEAVVVGTILSQSSIRYEVNFYPDIARIKNRDRDVAFHKLLVFKEQCEYL